MSNGNMRSMAINPGKKENSIMSSSTNSIIKSSIEFALPSENNVL